MGKRNKRSRLCALLNRRKNSSQGHAFDVVFTEFDACCSVVRDAGNSCEFLCDVSSASFVDYGRDEPVLHGEAGADLIRDLAERNWEDPGALLSGVLASG